MGRFRLAFGSLSARFRVAFGSLLSGRFRVAVGFSRVDLRRIWSFLVELGPIRRPERPSESLHIDDVRPVLFTARPLHPCVCSPQSSSLRGPPIGGGRPDWRGRAPSGVRSRSAAFDVAVPLQGWAYGGAAAACDGSATSHRPLGAAEMALQAGNPVGVLASAHLVAFLFVHLRVRICISTGRVCIHAY